jgi:hypothetical protein
MIMEEDKLKSLFAEFRPELSSDRRFMDCLTQNMESVEIVKRRMAETRARNRRAVTVAAVVGFVVGFLFSLTLPYLSGVVAGWQLTLPEESVTRVLADWFAVISWVVIGAVAVTAATNTYDMMTSKPIPLEQ